MRFAISLLGTEVFKLEFGEPELTVDELVRLGLETETVEDDERPAYGFAPPEETTC